MASTDTALSIAGVASRIDTISQARAALGAVASTLQGAYAKAATIGVASGVLHDYTPLGFVEDESTAEVRAAAASRLDVVNNYAQQLYSIWNDDPQLQDEEISAINAAKVGLCLSQANEALRDIEVAAEEEYWNFTQILTDAINAAIALGVAGIQKLANAAAAAGAAVVHALWPWLLGGVVVVGGLYYFRGHLLPKISVST